MILCLANFTKLNYFIKKIMNHFKTISLQFIFVLIFTIMHNSFSFSQTDLNQNKDQLISKTNELKEKFKFNAVIAGLWKGEQEIFTIALGESMTNYPATTDMHFRIGGVSEMFYGTLVIILAEQEKINLEDKISKFLPDLPNADKVTIQMLIKNTAGYKDYVYNNKFVDLILKYPFRYITREEIISYGTPDDLNFPPDTEQKYSHTEFTILAEVIERATGKKMFELYEENIFKPLGLTNTGYSNNANLPSPVLHSFSSDRKVYEDATFWSPSWAGESGPLYSNLFDLAKWGPVFGKGKLLNENSFNTLLSRFENTGKPDLYFASGFVVANGWYLQNPSMNGYSGGYGYFPEEEITLIVYSTETADTPSDKKAFDIFKELVKMVTPDSQINF